MGRDCNFKRRDLRSGAARSPIADCVSSSTIANCIDLLNLLDRNVRTSVQLELLMDNEALPVPSSSARLGEKAARCSDRRQVRARRVERFSGAAG